MTRLFAAQFTVLSLLLSQTGGANAIGGYGGGNCEVAEARLEALEVAVKKISDHLEINVHDEFRQVKEAVMMTVEEVHVVNEEVGGEVSEVKEAVDAIKTLVEAIATKANAIRGESRRPRDEGCFKRDQGRSRRHRDGRESN